MKKSPHLPKNSKKGIAFIGLYNFYINVGKRKMLHNKFAAFEDMIDIYTRKTQDEITRN